MNAVSGRPLLVVKKNQGGEGLHPALPFMTPEHSFRDLSLPHSFAQRTQQEAGRRAALQSMLTAVLIMPEAVFRFETGAGTPDQHGRVLLSPRQTAFAISYALTDSPPDAGLRHALAEGHLTTRDEVRPEVARLLENGTIDKPRILRFFREYFEYPRASEIFKDARPRRYYTFVVGDADAVMLAALAEDREVLRRLLTATLKNFALKFGWVSTTREILQALERRPAG